MMQSRSVFLLPVGAVLISCVAIMYPALLADCGKAIVGTSENRAKPVKIK